MKLLRLVKKHWLIIIILVGAAILRFWRLEELTTFGGDQGYDFLIVKRILVDGKFTLLGPKIGPYNQIGNLYLGPAYYYLLAPFLLLFRLDPIGPAILTVILALGTVFLIYLIGTKFLSRSIAILASSLYAINAFLIDQSRASSNPHLIPFFAALATYSTFEMIIKKSKSVIWPIICGVCLGVMFQLHYLAASFIIAVVLTLLLVRNFQKIIIVLAGFFIAISPQILFEIRHEFFVTKLFVKQLSVGQNVSSPAVFSDHFSNTVQQLFLTFTNTSQFLNLIILFLLISLYFYARKSQKSLSIAFLILTTVFGLVLTSLYSGEFGFHYLASIYVSFSLLLAASCVFLCSLFRNVAARTIIIIVIAQIFAVNILSLNLARREGFTMPTGWNLSGIKKASEIIAGDVSSGKTFNIASTLDGDTRARPYRYLVEVMGKIPLDVEHYPESDAIYLITRDDQEKIKSYTVWEVSSFMPFEINQQWEIQNGIKLYKLARVKS